MKLLNFEVDHDGISLNWQGHNLDLHNCYDFKALRYELATRVVELVWGKSPEPWAINAALHNLRLVFTDVFFFRIKERDAEFPFTEDDCLMGISFHPVELREEFDSISVSFSPADDLTLFFQSEWGIKLNSATAELLPSQLFHCLPGFQPGAGRAFVHEAGVAERADKLGHGG